MPFRKAGAEKELTVRKKNCTCEAPVDFKLTVQFLLLTVRFRKLTVRFRKLTVRFPKLTVRFPETDRAVSGN